MRLLEGNVEDPRDTRISDLEQENEELREQVTQLKFQLAEAQRAGSRGLSNLRRQLSPLYRALQDVFGELDKAGVSEAPAASSGRWDEWKARLGPGPAKVIDVLLLGGEMSIAAIALTGKMGKRTVYDATSKMGQAGILVRNGNKFSLKQ
jgi:ribosomal protein L29